MKKENELIKFTQLGKKPKKVKPKIYPTCDRCNRPYVRTRGRNQTICIICLRHGDNYKQ